MGNLPTPEPFPGYADADLAGVLEAINAAPEGEQREALKAAINTAERERPEPREAVLTATETPAPAPQERPRGRGPRAVEPVPDHVEDAADEAADTSGRPPLGELAEKHRNDSNPRIVNTAAETAEEE